MVEPAAVNRVVIGSSPIRGARLVFGFGDYAGAVFYMFGVPC